MHPRIDGTRDVQIQRPFWCGTAEYRTIGQELLGDVETLVFSSPAPFIGFAQATGTNAPECWQISVSRCEIGERMLMEPVFYARPLGDLGRQKVVNQLTAYDIRRIMTEHN